MVLKRNRKLPATVNSCLSTASSGLGPAVGIQTYQTTLSNSLGYADGWASSIWPMGTNLTFHNTGTSVGGDFGELNKLNYDYLIHLYDGRRRPGISMPLSNSLDPLYDVMSCIMQNTFDENGIAPPWDVDEDWDGECGTQRIKFGWEMQIDPTCQWPGWNHAVYFTCDPFDAPSCDGTSSTYPCYMMPETAPSCSNGGFSTYDPGDVGKQAVFEFSVSGNISPTEDFSGDRWALRVGLHPCSDGTPLTGYQAGTGSTGIDPNGSCGVIICTGSTMVGGLRRNDWSMVYTIQLGYIDQTNPWAALSGEAGGSPTDLQPYSYSAWVSASVGTVSKANLDDINYIYSGSNIMRWSSGPQAFNPETDRFRIVRNWNPSLTQSFTNGSLQIVPEGELFGYDKVDYQREILFQKSSNGGTCWETFWTENFNTLTDPDSYPIPASSGEAICQTSVSAREYLNQAYYSIVDMSQSNTSAFAITPSSSRTVYFDSASMTNYDGNYAGSPPEWSASISYVYPAGFITNDSQTSYTGSAIYKDYGLMWNTSNERERILGEIRYPAFNSYEEYSLDIRSMGKEYSILPEYKISDFVDNGTRLNKRFNWLSLPGAEITSSQDSAGGLNRDFFKEFSNSDFLSDFELISQQHDSGTLDLGDQEEISLTCNAILKLLPYEGFYPMTRTTQLATKFNEAFNTNLRLFEYEGSQDCFRKVSETEINNLPELKAIRQQGIVTPFFAPGILYNSIKSGVGVGWTIVTGSCLSEAYYLPNVTDPSQSADMSINTQDFLNTVVYNSASIARKLGFETLYNINTLFGGTANDPEGSLNGAFHIGYPEAMQGLFGTLPSSSFVNGALSASCIGLDVCGGLSSSAMPVNKCYMLAWDGAPNEAMNGYSLAMNNFLASTVRFFLQASALPSGDITAEGQLNFFSSNIVGAIAPNFHSGAVYYMDVVLSIPPPDVPSTPIGGILGGTPSVTPTFVMCESAFPEGAYLNEFEASDPFPRNEGVDPDEQNVPIYPVYNEFRALWDGGDGGEERGIFNTGVGFDGRYFGPATRKFESLFNWQTASAGAHYNVSDPAQAPYTPPYYYGESVARITYTPGDEWSDGNYQIRNPLNKFFDRMKITFSNKGIEEKIKRSGINYMASNPDWNVEEALLKGDLFTTSSFAYEMAQNVGDSVELQGMYNTVEREYNGAGTLEKISSKYAPDSARYIISTKFESPILDFSSQLSQTMVVSGGLHPTQSFSASSLECGVDDDAGTLFCPAFLNGTPVGLGRGMWSGYGTQTSSVAPGPTLFLRECSDLPHGPGEGKYFDPTEGVQRLYNPSLINAFKFIDDPLNGPNLAKGLGQLATNRIIKEAVVAIPYVDRFSLPNSPFATTVQGVDWYRSHLYAILNDTNERGPQASDEVNLFAINSDQVRDYKAQARVTSVSPTPNNQVENLLQKMNEFVFPPELDFLHVDRIDPFVMYVFPFEHSLEKIDLQDIWQGVLPEIGVKAKMQNYTIKHSLTSGDEFFHGKKLPPQIRWFVFKVKQRGAMNYNDVTLWAQDDLAGSVTRDYIERETGGTTVNEAIPNLNEVFSYNWPHDFFSLVELGKLEAKIKFKK